MPTSTRTDLFLKKIAELAEFAKRADDFFPDEVCNFLIEEYKLDAAVIFNINPDKSFTVLSKSNNARTIFSKGSNHICPECALILESLDKSFNSDPTCQVKVSDYLLNESCFIININSSQKLLFKIAKKSVLDKDERDRLSNSLLIIGSFFNTWNLIKNVGDFNKEKFSQLYINSTQEIKNNINSIIGFTSLISEENLPASSLEYTTSIKRNAQNLLLYINDLNEIAKADSNQLIVNHKKIVLENLVNELATLFKTKLSNKKINFVINTAKELSKPIDIDDQKLRYILTNIILFFITILTEGIINITITLQKDSKLKFEIFETKNDLPKNLISTLFEPFALSKKSEFKNSNLAGLSLTLVKKYVTFLGGEISVISNKDGTKFIFTINGEVMTDLETKLSQLPKPTTKNRVLVIEDDYATSKLLSSYLNKWGYNPTIVNTEEQAFSVINSEQLLAIILDIEIPHINGLELLKKIHEHPNAKNVPVIACSIEPEQQKAFMMGAVEYFVKPINYNYLVEVLTHYKLRKDSNVLCVDDDVPTLNLVKQAIESIGFNAIAESVSANVMNLIRDKDIDLAIIDLDMPTPNGFELIKLIKSEKRFANLPIIIYTGKENYKEDLSKIEGLFEELLDKRSTNIEDLADTINAMINRFEEPPPVEQVIKKTDGIKILLAEDYKHSQIIVTRLLKKNNFDNIVVVENGEDAVKMASGDKFDLILMDMQMPIMNGFEATEKIRQLPEYKNIPIIALTAFAMKGDREKCLESGATDYIPKPIDSKEFIEKVKYYTHA